MFGVSACRVWKLSSRLNVSALKCLSSVRVCTTKAWKGRKDEAIESRKEVERMNIDFTLKIFQKLHSNDLNDVMKQTFADFCLTREQSLMILNSDAFMSLNDKIVLALLQNGDIIRNNVTSEELWNALAKWCKMQKMEANNESNDGKYWMQYMKPFVSFIDFTKMDATFFMDNIENISENYHIIGKDLKYDIIKQHCSDLIEKSKCESKSKGIENREIENIEMDARMSHILKQESNLSAQWKVFQTEKEKFEKEMKLFKDAKREFENSKNNEIDASSELIEKWKIDLSNKEKQLENEKSMLNEEKEKVKLRESRLDALQRSLALRDELLMKKEAKMEEIKNDMKTSQWKINKMENEMKNKENKVKNILERLQDAEDKINEKMKKIATSKEELSPNQQSDQNVESIETFETIESTESIEESEKDNMDYKQKYQFQHWWPK